MFRGKNGFTNACLVQLGILLASFLAWDYLRTVAFLAGPPSIDPYARTWPFQLFVGAFYLAGALVAFIVLLIIEAALRKLYRLIAYARRRRARRRALVGNLAR
ncbi:hypothetical protein [Rhodanobacter sp. MP7CTX1]|uniref:hypothetical protein n=1 Tax=Rhodanobacter sp. MP7CTX1 TaxID=2723084 RepID=UPI00161EF7C9|nr:hypothetical protein [Rhodanobacter sp. MP7CTX1]MBB6185961.1 hypothetical protein [Rhodanobacter sp. MP7CTX1]